MTKKIEFEKPEVGHEAVPMEEQYQPWRVTMTVPANSWYLHGLMSYFFEEGKRYCLLQDKDRQQGVVFEVVRQDPVGMVQKTAIPDVVQFVGWGRIMSSEYLGVPQDTPLGYFDVWEYLRSKGGK